MKDDLQMDACLKLYYEKLAKKPAQGAMLCMILKSGKPGKPRFYKYYGESTPQELINYLEKLNPGTKWIAAE